MWHSLGQIGLAWLQGGPPVQEAIHPSPRGDCRSSHLETKVRAERLQGPQSSLGIQQETLSQPAAGVGGA